ncbi:trypsin-1 [Cephus cinctus]|uniref:Trypsin-1 n=1 Tax=Cephus cinctus TaxID=211228 RepID=A0AAJ7BVZ1_CEPCN|nr:trypsin-1 [Cephus cinctus]
MRILCFLLTACFCLSSVTAILERIVGGTATAIENIPFQLSLVINKEVVCGAVLIATNKAITAAQCVHGLPSTAVVTVKGGTSYRTSLGTSRNVNEIKIHNNFNQYTYDYDIAILTLSQKFELSKQIALAKLPIVNEIVAPGKIANVSGWGITTIGGTEYAGLLQTVQVPIVATKVCASAHARLNTVTDRMLCAGFTTGGNDWCKGDVGGPLVYAGKVIGLASWGASCGSVGSPGVYTRIAALRQWISTNAGV